jgi:hypothetical protein
MIVGKRRQAGFPINVLIQDSSSCFSTDWTVWTLKNHTFYDCWTQGCGSGSGTGSGSGLDPDLMGCLDPDPNSESGSGYGSRGKKKKKMKKK